ncbi:phosphoribosylglycinamide formyltransferase [bacterium]|nr:phosphoribosylglycinamide formyltransferase [bacterium]
MVPCRTHPRRHSAVSAGHVLLSGGGTTLQNILDCCQSGRIDARVIAVVSSRPGVGGLARAERAGVPALLVERKAHPDTPAFSAALAAALAPHKPDLVCMAGFMSLWTIPEEYQGRVMNIHPALIPAFCGHGFYGHHVHEAVLAAGAKVSGATVHFADNQYDHGPIILQRAVPVLEGDTPDSLAARVHCVENELYPEAIQLFAEGRLVIEAGACAF